MNYYEMNLNLIRENKPYLYEQMQKKADLNNKDLEDIYTTDTKDGKKALIIRKDKKEYYLNSTYYPEREARQWVEQYEIKNMNAVILMFGLGNGIFSREILKKKKESDTLVIYEPSIEIFYYILQNYDITDVLKNAIIIIEELNETELNSMLRGLLDLKNISSQIWCIHPKYNEVFKINLQKFMKNIKDINNHEMVLINTQKNFGTRYITNILYNLRYIKNSNLATDYTELLNTEVPAIVVAAGPSLKSNIEGLKRAKGKSYIFVVDRILDYILDQGIEPDFIVTVDPIKPLEYFTNRTDVSIPLICKLDSNWEVLERHKGRKIISSFDYYIAKMYSDLGQSLTAIDTGNSVATVAFSTCMMLGFKKIILVGQDLAYDGDFTHAGGIAEKTSTKEIYVEGVDGNQVKSRWDWYTFLRWFQERIAENPELEVIDAKEKGAKIKGTTNMSLNDAVNKYCTTPVDIQLLDTLEYTFDSSQLEEVKTYLEKQYNELDILKRKLENAVDICSKQIKEYSRKHQVSNMARKNDKKLLSINKYIKDSSIYLLLDYYTSAKSTNHLTKMYEFTDNEKSDIIATYESSKDIYMATIEAIDFVKPLMKETLENV